MQIVENNKDFSESVNFIDSNDNFVGFDMAQCCCEHAFYVFYKKTENAFVEVNFADIPEEVHLVRKVDFKIHPSFVNDSTLCDESIAVKDKLNQRIMCLESEVQDRIEDARQYKDYVKRSQTVLEKERDNFKDAWRTASKRVYMSCGLIMLMAVLLVGPSIWRMFSGN